MTTVVAGDITKIRADVIVNAANTENVHGGGVDLAIAHAAGQDYKKAANENNGVVIGEFLVSPAGKLHAEVIIDVPTIDLTTGQRITFYELATVWRKILSYCTEKGYKTIATPLLGAGMVGMDRHQVIDILTKESASHKDLNIKIVVFN